VQCFGEPSRKGSGGWTGIWLEWGRVEILAAQRPRGDDAVGEDSRDTTDGDAPEVVEIGIMVELRDPGGAEVLTEKQQKEGAGGIWDRAAEWEWAALKFFRPEPRGAQSDER